jgi:hypothetical protein
MATVADAPAGDPAEMERCANEPARNAGARAPRRRRQIHDREAIAHEEAAETHREAQRLQEQHAAHSRQLAQRRGG